MSDAQLVDAYISMVEDRAAGGWEAYLLTLMFNQLRGNERTKQRTMLKECEAIYGRLLTRFVKRPHNTPIAAMPFWLSCLDWPVNTKNRSSMPDIMTNDGMHIHAIFMVPPNARTGKRLNEIVAEAPKAFLVGEDLALSRLHVAPLERTLPKAALYGLKQVTRKRQTSADILVLPRSHSEVA